MAPVSPDVALEKSKGMFVQSGNARVYGAPFVQHHASGVSARLCFNFAIVGRACPKKSECKFAHVAQYSRCTEQDKAALDEFIAHTPNISWATGHGPPSGTPR